MLLINFIGKPYAGKLHVRFDEGVGKVFFFPSRSTLLAKEEFTTEITGFHGVGHGVNV